MLRSNLLLIAKRVFFIIFLALAIHLLLPQIASLKSEISLFKGINFLPLFVAMLMQILSYFGSGYCLVKIHEAANQRISISRGVLITLASYSFGLVAGGMVGSSAVTFKWVKTSGGKNDVAALAATIPPILVDLCLLVISIYGISKLFLDKSLTQLQIIAFLILLSLMLIIFFVVTFFSHRREKFLQSIINTMQRYLPGFVEKKRRREN